MIKHINGVGLLLALSLMVGAGPLAGGPAAPQGTTLVPEGNDFATHVLDDPWDMSQFSDISAYLNDSGQRAYLQNIQVANGLFSAQSTVIGGGGDANFALLFPGYQNAIRTSKDGALHPIISAQYHCLYVAMNVQSGGGDQGQIFWFSDDKLNTGAQWGASAGFGVASNRWTLYKFDLASLGVLAGSPWSSRSNWQGLRFDPTGQANVNFQIDWARLTDCGTDNATITWPQNGSVSVMRLRPVGTTRDIQVKSSLNGNAGSATLDVQGIQPGTYTVRLFNSGGGYVEDAYNQLVINQAPIANFVRPSFTSGADFASQGGDPWDFSNSGDVQSAPSMSTSTHDSLFDMTTASGPAPNGADPQLFLHASLSASPSTYRYLSFRLYTEWSAPWANVPDGMVIRWVWGIQGASGQPTNRCYLVSHDIPFDVGWRVYNIDLWDGYNGSPLEKTTDCPANAPSWHSSTPVLVFRLDPNENVSVALDPITNGSAFHQLLDWVRLTAMDSVKQGTPYELQVHLNRPAGDVTGVQYYYTTNPANPTQSSARHYTARTLNGPFHAYLPLMQIVGGAVASGDAFPSPDLKFMWDTAAVSPDIYYLCAVVSIAPNTATYCSDAPIQVR